MHRPRVSATAPEENKGAWLYSEITRARRDLKLLELAPPHRDEALPFQL